MNTNPFKERKVKLWIRKIVKQHWKMRLLRFQKTRSKVFTKKIENQGWLKLLNPQFLSPQPLAKVKLGAKFGKFLGLLKKLQINIPSLDVIFEMPSYAKFLKEILSNKQKLQEHAMVSLMEECSAILQNKLPPKLEDRGSFSTPCALGMFQLVELCLTLEQV